MLPGHDTRCAWSPRPQPHRRSGQIRSRPMGRRPSSERREGGRTICAAPCGWSATGRNRFPQGGGKPEADQTDAEVDAGLGAGSHRSQIRAAHGSGALPQDEPPDRRRPDQRAHLGLTTSHGAGPRDGDGDRAAPGGDHRPRRRPAPGGARCGRVRVGRAGAAVRTRGASGAACKAGAFAGQGSGRSFAQGQRRAATQADGPPRALASRLVLRASHAGIRRVGRTHAGFAARRATPPTRPAGVPTKRPPCVREGNSRRSRASAGVQTMIPVRCGHLRQVSGVSTQRSRRGQILSTRESANVGLS